MRLATRALFTALVMLVLCAAVSAQTLRKENDPRNQAPTVGTGGAPGGPTGLFTIYDGDTIRRGEYTFSIAYSNYDRDPGDVDIVETPLSFNIGLNDHLELFFNTNGYRGVKVNNPRHLSGFYLPNSQLFFPTLCSPQAIILAPERVSGTQNITGAVFRPAGPPCNVGGQRFVQFPFVNGVGPNFGLTGSPVAPPFVSRLGAPIGGGGNYGDAAFFPGYGSAVGSILPGVVLTTRTIPANLTFAAQVVPDLSTIAPTYIADAPFINRLYGESIFGSFVVGGKIRFTGPNNPLGVGLVAFYRFYPDKADDFSGFNQLQRGASPGGDIGDFGFVGVVSGRLSKHANLSANVGFILNSNPRSEAFGGPNVALLNRPDELLAGVGFDFPVNKHFQIITEVKSIHYIRSRTENAFPNNPVDILGGVRIFPRRWLGFSAAYRQHVNQQGDRLFGLFDHSYPAGFRESEDPHGFLAQFFVGHRNPRGLPVPPNQPPTVSVSSSSSSVMLPCPEGTSSATCTPSSSREVTLTADSRDPDNDTLLHTWTVTGGRITGEGRTVSWDLSGVNPGTYTASVEVNDGNQHTANATTTVTVAVCTDCKPPCPTVSVSCPSEVNDGDSATFTASVGDSGSLNLTYNWSVSAGTISGGQGTSSITVDTKGVGGSTITATVELGGVDPACSRTASCTTSVKTIVVPTPTKFDEYGNIRFNDEKARLDNYAIALQNDPTAQGTIIAYGSCEGEGQARADRAKNYLVNTRGIDAGRLTAVDGGCREDLTVQLWVVPSGATAPAASESSVTPCPQCKRAGRRRARRGDE
ncbi:MAG: hypothetical protein WAL47_09810 [Pyrinomonadaceae bacterium]